MIYRTAKVAAKAAWRYRYNRSHAKTAFSILTTLEENGGTFAGSSKTLCDEYAIDVLGSRKYAPWLYVYSYVAGGFKEGWIPDNFYGERVVGEISGPYGVVSTLRALNFKLFKADEFPDVGYYVNGVFADKEGHGVAPDKIEDIVFGGGDRVVYKLDQSLQGTGIHIFNRSSFSLDEILELGNGSFQTFIEQHNMFSEMSGDSVATLRLTTASDDSGQVTLRAGYLRLGRTADTHVQSASQVRVAIDLESGELSEHGYLANWLKVEAHPDTGVSFRAKSIPNYQRCIDVTLACHSKMPQVRCIGWDIAVDSDNKVKIIEWNGGHNDIKFGEATQGPCFKDLNWQRFKN